MENTKNRPYNGQHKPNRSWGERAQRGVKLEKANTQKGGKSSHKKNEVEVSDTLYLKTGREVWVKKTIHPERSERHNNQKILAQKKQKRNNAKIQLNILCFGFEFGEGGED